MSIALWNLVRDLERRISAVEHKLAVQAAADPFPECVRRFVAEVKQWEGTAAELSALLNARGHTDAVNWPGSPEAVGKRLNSMTGIVVTRGPGGPDGKQRIIRLSELTD